MLLIALLAQLWTAPAFAVDSRELAALTPQIVEHYKQGQDGFFKTVDGLKLHYHINLAQDPRGTIVIVNGRGESHLKYAELIYDLNHLGYSIYTYDHRGQGLSQGRLADFPDRDDIIHFDSMATDLATFVAAVVPKAAPLYMIAHSMGGLVAARFTELYPKTAARFKAVALNSPALGLQTGYPDAVAEGLACLIYKATDYAPGQGPYDPNGTFANNGVTSSPERFAFNKARMQSVPGATLGGVTDRWICQTIRAGHAAQRSAIFIHVPLFISSATDDSLVRPLDEQFFCGLNFGCHIQSYPGQHELLMERDEIRNQVIADILGFFRAH
jgi:lysophospholipase